MSLPTDSPEARASKTWDHLPETVQPALVDLWQQNQRLTAEVSALRKELEQIQTAQKNTLNWGLLAQPGVILAASLGAALAFAALIILDQELSKAGGRHAFFLLYIMPISAPFVAFVLDRAVRVQEQTIPQWMIDLPVIVLSIARALSDVPFISGHALFLAYALLTLRSRVAQALAVLVLAQVIYLKVFAWHDPTLFGGMLVGIVTAGLFHLTRRKQPAG